MLIASYSNFGYTISPESVGTLQQLLTALNALPAAWANKMPVRAVTVGPDVSSPQLDTFGLDFVLWPSSVWAAAEAAWADVGILVDEGAPRPFGLHAAQTILEAKERVLQLLQDYEQVASTEFTPAPVVPTPIPPPAPTPAPPTPTPPTPAPPAPTPPAPTVVRERLPSWPWLVAGLLGMGTLIAVLTVRATGPELHTRRY